MNVSSHLGLLGKWSARHRPVWFLRIPQRLYLQASSAQTCAPEAAVCVYHVSHCKVFVTAQLLAPEAARYCVALYIIGG